MKAWKDEWFIKGTNQFMIYDNKELMQKQKSEWVSLECMVGWMKTTIDKLMKRYEDECNWFEWVQFSNSILACLLPQYNDLVSTLNYK